MPSAERANQARSFHAFPRGVELLYIPKFERSQGLGRPQAYLREHGTQVFHLNA